VDILLRWMLCIVKKTIETVISTGNHAVIQVKKNQKKLFNEVNILFDEQKSQESYKQPLKHNHGRIEQRKVEIVSVPEYLRQKLERWFYIMVIVKVTRLRVCYSKKKRKYEKSIEESYFISTTNLSAKEFCKIIQGHWKIENQNHNVRDVSFKEDLSRIRVNPSNFIILRSFALNIFRNNNVLNISAERFLNCCMFENIFKYNDFRQY